MLITGARLPATLKVHLSLNLLCPMRLFVCVRDRENWSGEIRLLQYKRIAIKDVRNNFIFAVPKFFLFFWLIVPQKIFIFYFYFFKNLFDPTSPPLSSSLVLYINA